jgi:hypothetical protein
MNGAGIAEGESSSARALASTTSTAAALVHRRRISAHQAHVDVEPARVRYAARNALQDFACTRACRRAQRADRAGARRFRRDHVVGAAGADDRNAEHDGVVRIGLARGDMRQAVDEGSDGRDRIARVVRRRRMAAGSAKHDTEVVERGEHRAGPARNRVRAPARVDVQRERGRDPSSAPSSIMMRAPP